MKIDKTSGLLTPASYCPSPNCDSRPEGEMIDTIVVHNISLPPGEFGTNMVQRFFCGKLDTSLHPYFKTIETLKVSAHLFIDRQGGVTQFVPFHERAWHAGESYFQGRSKCNDFSIGIELEGTDDLPYSSIQYQVLTQIIKLLIMIYPSIKREYIVGHSDIASGRKTDPGSAFDWDYLNKLLTE